MIRVFYAGLLYGEYEGHPIYADLPEGAYIATSWPGGQWYHKHHGVNLIMLEDVPKEVRTLALLLT